MLKPFLWSVAFWIVSGLANAISGVEDGSMIHFVFRGIYCLASLAWAVCAVWLFVSILSWAWGHMV